MNKIEYIKPQTLRHKVSITVIMDSESSGTGTGTNYNPGDMVQDPYGEEEAGRRSSDFGNDEFGASSIW